MNRKGNSKYEKAIFITTGVDVSWENHKFSSVKLKFTVFRKVQKINLDSFDSHEHFDFRKTEKPKHVHLQANFFKMATI